ncbi:MAG: phospholipase D-like domain-containing protein [Desulfovibrio sp.]|jgi:phosphatidylserine/phosphatidylglycerophosphate/cardiolipin synthase-like enzyme|nr:phospholipase D-like domain-containing protein [Desulfovibrio sp.]
MIEIINTPLHKKFLSLCQSANAEIYLCSPFIKEEIVDDILLVKKDEVNIKLITNINLKNFYNQASDISAIKKLVLRNTVYNRSDLHAKFYIFDRRTCIITSANLTKSGLKRNFEYGIITNNECLINKALEDYKLLTTDELTGKISIYSVNRIKNILKSIPKMQFLKFPNINLHMVDDIYDNDKKAILDNLTGWQKNVFIELNSIDKLFFSSETVSYLADKLKNQYPNNHNRAAKIRQVLQRLRDIGLIRFISPGKYLKLWI